MNVDLEWCVKNAPTGVREAIERVRAERPGVTVRKYACVEQCGLCARGPFALVGGAVVAAERPECLAQRLLAAIDEATGGIGHSRLPST
ncbi:YuzB family protein [Alicyclobacillus acidocaldarius]|uniref:DUF1450 domain-containing protein n=1 Tax=Alicyclobacillus acidocaldarius subsp. acidocaldarius (strain ATCC 27009 / DSM 446 / BCRC 14685 / JCM 5260 / KCTC 1825 / NBRC 15652 / NCIMB 11725 / NRRL B-14509 / 104-IA) TaxID=521098 RepID=C8WRZ0_ALIAD|nr:YuzB family protein [Alicyclobacillus acidocaldarius]ACV57424.1 protein of unknown function DUF1450 [Alicyclobacillus acidocaldarius subsp. acidocaldarius DSM 446]